MKDPPESQVAPLPNPDSLHRALPAVHAGTRLKFLITTSFYPPYHVGGACLHVKWLSEELARLGHEVHVMFSLDAYEIKKGKIPRLNIQPGTVHLHPLRSPRGRIEPLLVYLRGTSSYISREFQRLLKEISPDVVHHHNISLLGYDLLLKRGPYLNLYTAHDHWFICQLNDFFKNGSPCKDQRACGICAIRSRRPPQFWRSRKFFTHAIHEIDLAIAPSVYLMRTLSEKTRQNFVTVPNFVPHPPVEISSSGFSNYFLYAGRLERNKGVMELAELFRDHWKDIGASLIVAGTGSLERTLREYVKRNGLGNIVRVLGWCTHDSLYPLYRDALGLVVPSLCPENFALVCLEAFSVGTPVVVSNRGGLPEIANLQGKNFVCDPGQFKEALIEVRTTAPDRQLIRDIYQRYFSPERYLESYLEIISRIMSSTHAR
jgi:glycosyltransferase involved in cell wall biosynthesis